MIDKEFTPLPFWFWNDELTEDELKRQIGEMQDKGIEGFVIHPRKGLSESIPYLSEPFFHFVRFAVEEAARRDMKVVLYDEAMYPSGSCHGEVVRSNPSFASVGLARVCNVGPDGKENITFRMEPSGGTIRGVHDGEDDGEPNAPKSADLLNPAAVARFIELTHERYYHELKEHFGNTIIAFFTDEPCILGRCARKGLIPWSAGLMEEFVAAGGSEGMLPDLFAEGENAAKRIYRRVVHERLANSYYRQLSEWCQAHDIALMGHPEKSTDIGYLNYFHIPCQDVVWRFVAPEDELYITGEHSTMAKCSSDSARHRHKRRNGNECFGVCSKPETPEVFTELDMRWYLNWLFVRGVNPVVPHAFYYSVRGDRGLERPPEVGMHNPFWPRYGELSAYIRRLCAMLTDVHNGARVAVLCTADQLSWQIARPLFEGQIEFNYLEEELLSGCQVEDSSVTIAGYRYPLILCDRQFLEDATDDSIGLLKRWQEQGVTLWEVSDQEDAQRIQLKRVETMTLASAVREKLPSTYLFQGDTRDIRCTELLRDDGGESGGAYPIHSLLITNEGQESAGFDIILAPSAKERITAVEDTYRQSTDELPAPAERITLTLPPCESRVVILKEA